MYDLKLLLLLRHLMPFNTFKTEACGCLNVHSRILHFVMAHSEGESSFYFFIGPHSSSLQKMRTRVTSSIYSTYSIIVALLNVSMTSMSQMMDPDRLGREGLADKKIYFTCFLFIYFLFLFVYFFTFTLCVQRTETVVVNDLMPVCH